MSNSMAEPALLARYGSPAERVERAAEALKEGRGILLTDDENRENEGDLIFAASRMTTEQMALMIRACSGIVVGHYYSRSGTACPVSIEAAEGVTTGVSAADRIRTIRAAIAPDAGPTSLCRPGHVFPLIARPGGVLEREGHTEGSVDLARIAGLPPYAVLCELTNEDGTMARLPQVVRFAREHGYPVVTIDDIKTYRKNRNI